MKNWKRYLALFVCALTAVTAANVNKASAYFTDHTEAKGGYHVVAKDVKTIPEEQVSELQKTITVKNTGEVDCWARAKVISGSLFDIAYGPGADWREGGDGYWYYDKILNPESDTEVTQYSTPITASISIKDEVDPDEFMSEFNVVVITECTPVLYDSYGQPYANWELAAQQWEIDENGEWKESDWL